MKNQSNGAVVFDLEYTAWEGSEERDWSGPDENREVIQFGAVIMYFHSNSWHQGETFEMYVRPMLRPKLSDYIKELTGISQQTIDQFGLNFAVALNAFRQFVPVNARLFSNGTDGSILNENCILHGINFPFDEGDLVNVRPFITEQLGIEQKFSSSDLAGILGFRKSKKHDALSDALVVANTLVHLKWEFNL